jgi:hypothetical protein
MMGDRADREFGEIRVMTLDWPIVVTAFPEKRVPDATLQSVLGHIEWVMVEAVKRREKLFFITDLTAMREITPASQRQFTAEWIKRNADLSRASSVGGATVTPSSILRGIITALYWLQPPPTPAFPAATRHEAMLRGIERLEAERVLLSPRLVAYRDKHRKTGFFASAR